MYRYVYVYVHTSLHMDVSSCSGSKKFLVVNYSANDFWILSQILKNPLGKYLDP
jgi:hypothetical protein